MIILLVLLAFTAMSAPAYSQISCFQYAGGVTSCDTPRGNTTITELSPGQGIITQQGRHGSTIEPYTIIGQDRERRSGYSSTPFLGLDRPSSSSSYGGSSIYDSTTFEERQAIRDSGRIPW